MHIGEAMKHRVVLDTRFEDVDDAFLGRNECTCGWYGKDFEITEPAERLALENERRAHKMQRVFIKVWTVFMFASAAMWVVLLSLGAWGLVRTSGLMA
jgi:hypothetical protein